MSYRLEGFYEVTLTSFLGPEKVMTFLSYLFINTYSYGCIYQTEW